MIFKNARVFIDGSFKTGGFEVGDGRFIRVFTGNVPEEGVDMNGAKVIPGLVDVHSHGNSGADFSDGDYEGLVAMGRYLLKNGITSFAPASMTLPYETLKKAFATAVRIREEKPAGAARLMGVHMEGPYFSEKKKGAQNASFLKLPDFEGFKELYDECNGLIRIVDVAPELEGAEEFVKKASALCTVSVAHTDSEYEPAAAAFEAGSRHVTHLFNAMPSIHHRKPGVIGAAAEREDVVAELISDGLHIHPSIVRMAFRLFPGRICLISDALRCAGMPDGEYPFGGQTLTLKDGEARMPDGALAGSVTNLFECMHRAISFGVSEEEAIMAATLTPACEIGCGKDIGSIEAGKYADFIVCDDQLNRLTVYAGGEKVQ